MTQNATSIFTSFATLGCPNARMCLRLRWTCEHRRLLQAFSDSCFRCRAVNRDLNALIFPPKPKPN